MEEIDTHTKKKINKNAMKKTEVDNVIDTAWRRF